MQSSIRLFKRQQDTQDWELEDANVRINFYDRNEDKATGPKLWCLEAGALDTPISDDFASDPGPSRVVIQDEHRQFWALKFPTVYDMDQFVAECEGKLFENVYNKEHKPENLAKVTHSNKSDISCQSYWPFMWG